MKNEAIIIGVVDLNKLPVYFPAADYGNETQIYLVERETGNFLQDTQHKTLGNMYGFGDRKTKKGYSSDQFVSDIAAGKIQLRDFFVSNIRRVSLFLRLTCRHTRLDDFA